MRLDQHRIAIYAFFIFLLGYLLTYPAKVFTRSQSLSLVTIAIAIIILACIVGMKLFLNAKIQRNSLVIILFLYLFYISVILNFLVFQDNYYSLLIYKYGIYTSVLFLFFILKPEFTIKKNKYLDFGLLSTAIFMLSAAILNSFFQRLPSGLDELSYQYYIGPFFVRAGGGYIDPNYLGMLLGFCIYFISQFAFRKWVAICCYLAIAVSILLTFSRGALMASAIIILLIALKKKSTLKYIVFSGIFLIITFVFWGDEIVFFERFTSTEATSSTDSRFEQYHIFYNYISNHFEIQNFIIGFGGMNRFVELANIALHNFFMSIFFDFGLIGTILSLVITLLFFLKCNDFAKRLLFIYIMIIMQFQHNLPDTVYFLYLISFCRISISNSESV